MSKHLIHVKIANPETVTKYIPTIRKYDGTAIEEIKKRILTGYAITFDWGNYGDLVDEMNDTNPHKEFRLLIDKLITLGADLEFYDEYDGVTTLATLQLIDNKLERLEEIREETERDIERELGLRDWETC